MKKYLLPLLMASAALTLYFSSCKKADRPESLNSTTSTDPLLSTTARFQDSVTISSYGFLVFASKSNLLDYYDFVLTHTHRQVQNYLDSLGFTSIGHSIYSGTTMSTTVTTAQAYDYLWNADQTIQLMNLVMRPIGNTSSGDEVNWQYLLVMDESNLNSSNYENLSIGEYDGNCMNKFATNADGEEENIFVYTAENPFGYDSGEPNSTEVAFRPFIGTVRTNDKIDCAGSAYYNGAGNCVKGCQKTKVYKTYFFWIGTGSMEESSPYWSGEIPQSPELCGP